MNIKITSHNEVYIRVFSDQIIEQELSKFFSFKVPGYQFMPKFKNKMWDGNIYLYNLNSKTLYAGLIDYVYEFAKRNGYECTSDTDALYQDNGITVDQIKSFTHSLNLHGRGSPITIRDYQIDGIHTAINRNRALLLSPTSSGKSLIIYSCLRWHLANDRKCLIIVPSTQLVEQLYADFEDYSCQNGFDVGQHCQKLYSGFSKDFTKEVLVSTWQSIVNMPKSFFDQFDVVINDECHLAKSQSLTSIMEKLTSAKYRIGTTGTLDGTLTNSMVLEGLFGRVHQVTTTRELIDNNSAVELNIKCLLFKYNKETRQALRDFTYKDEMTWLVTNPTRNKFIRNLAVSTNGNTLVLFQLVEKHGKPLYEMIKNKVHDGRKVFLVYGGVDTLDRENIRKIYETETNAIIVASYGVFSTGINVPSIENIIFASPSKSKIRNLQSIGRGLRLKDGKTQCKLFDICDDLSWKSHINHTLNHAKERYKIYKAEQFKTKIIEVNIDEA